MKDIRILLVDDHAIVRQGIRTILSIAFDRAKFGEAGNTGEAIDLVSKQEWDLVVLDIQMPGRDGIDALKELRTLRPNLPVLMLTAYPEEQMALRVLKAGGAGYLTKDRASEELALAVQTVVDGHKYIPDSLAERLAVALQGNSTKAPHEMLSDREYQVLRLFGAARSVKEIAAELSLSVKTVSTYRTRILEKLKLHSNAELTRYAIQQGLADWQYPSR
jgi:two-component system invasion response regulator UvrY